MTTPKFLVKFSAAVLLCAMLAASLVGCKETGQGPDTSVDTSVPGTESQTEPETPPEPAKITLAKNGGAALKIVLKKNAKPTVDVAARQLRQRLLDFADIYFVMGVDNSAKDGTQENPSAAIVIGHSDRSDEKAFRAELAAAGEHAFGIRMTENAIIITATHEDYVPLAIDYFLENYMPKADAEGVEVVRCESITLTAREDVIKVGQMSGVEEIFTDHRYATLSEKVGTIPKDGNFKILQGGCATADYAWFAMINTADYDTQAAGVWIYKLDAKTWKVIKKSEVLMLDHANDITYLPETNEIAVAHCYVDSKKITLLNADTLTVTRVLRADRGFYSVAYNAERKEFVCGTGKANMNFFSASLLFRKYADGSGTQLVTQGIDCDKNYVYHVLFTSSTPGEPDNMIFVNRYDTGAKVNKIRLSIAGQEPENISVVDGGFIIGCNNSATPATADIYRTELVDFGAW